MCQGASSSWPRGVFANRKLHWALVSRVFIRVSSHGHGWLFVAFARWLKSIFSPFPLPEGWTDSKLQLYNHIVGVSVDQSPSWGIFSLNTEGLMNSKDTFIKLESPSLEAGIRTSHIPFCIVDAFPISYICVFCFYLKWLIGKEL